MLGASKLIDHSLQYLKATYFSDQSIQLAPASYYANSEWDKEVIDNEGFWRIQEGESQGKCIGGSMFVTNLLIGSEYMPPLADKILFLEDNQNFRYRGVQNQLQAILNQPDADKIRGIIIGRFQREIKMSRERITKMIESKKLLKNIPVVANIDFGIPFP